MSSFVAFGSRQISLSKRSHSSFALVVSFPCVGKEFPPPSGNADEECQWEIKTDEGCVLYWDS
jgi:hypothetical protein